MNDFNPGDGWREITYQESVNGRRYLRKHGDDGVPTHTWVPEEPVPPLPTEDGWYIELTTGVVWRLHDVDGWTPANGLRVERAEPIPSVRRLR